MFATAARLEVYTRNGWSSSHWDRERCRDELIRWAREKREADREANQMKSEAQRQKRLADHERRERLLAQKAAAVIAPAADAS